MRWKPRRGIINRREVGAADRVKKKNKERKRRLWKSDANISYFLKTSYLVCLNERNNLNCSLLFSRYFLPSIIAELESFNADAIKPAHEIGLSICKISEKLY